MKLFTTAPQYVEHNVYAVLLYKWLVVLDIDFCQKQLRM